MFKPLHDLESLTPEQREEHYQAACAYFQVPPEMRLLDFIYMDSGDGKRNLVLYAKKGATDLIRANLGISTVKLTKDIGDGYIAWIAEGRDKNGRLEQAVGSASTQGLKGQSLASAVMIAQTRATRRMTLQFVGGGLLDESELNETTVDINRANTSLASMATLPAPQPAVTPNADAGKDVTKVQGNLSPEAMIVPEPFSGGSIIPESAQTLVQIEPEPKHRRRRTKAEMAQAAINVVFDAVMANDTEAIKIVKFAEQVVGEAQTEVPSLVPGPVGQAINQVVDQVVEQAAAELLPAVDYPTAEQEAEYRKRLQTWVDILKAAGMTGGINWRLKRYTLALFPDAVVDNGRLKLTTTQWDTLLNTFNDKQHQLGPQALVAEINAIAEKA